MLCNFLFLFSDFKYTLQWRKTATSTLLRMVKTKFPSLDLDECKDLIKRAKVNNGGSLTGLQMGEIIVLIKTLKKERQSTHNQKKRYVGKTCYLCFRTFSRN